MKCLVEKTALALLALGTLCGRSETFEEILQRNGLKQALSQGQLEVGKLPWLVLWLKADTGITTDAPGRISAWTDPARHVSLTQTVEAQMPSLTPAVQNGLPAVHFAGNAFTLGAKDFSLGDKSLAVVLVARVTTASFAGSFFSYGPPDMNSVPPFQISQYRDTGTLFRDYRNAETLLPGAGFLILEADYDAGKYQFSLYVNGNLLGSKNISEELPANGPLTLGGMIGDIAEVVAFNLPLDLVTRTAITRHFLTKYGLTAGQKITLEAAELPLDYYINSNEIVLAFDKHSPLLREYLAATPRPPVTPPPTTEPGVNYAFYPDPPKDYSLPDFTKVTPGKTGVTAMLSQAPAADGTIFVGDYKNPTTILFKGYLNVPQTGIYTFGLRRYDVAQFWISNRLVIDHPPGLYGASLTNRGGVITLGAGMHPVMLAIKQYGTGVPDHPPELIMWSFAGKAPVPIPADRLSHAAVAAWQLPLPVVDTFSPLPAEVEALTSVDARVVAIKSRKVIATFTMLLDATGRGQCRYPMPHLDFGEYAVEWLVAGTPVRATRTISLIYEPCPCR